MFMNGKINISKMPTLSKQSTNLKISLSKFQWCFSKELGRNKHKFDIESHKTPKCEKILRKKNKLETLHFLLISMYVYILRVIKMCGHRLLTLLWRHFSKIKFYISEKSVVSV